MDRIFRWARASPDAGTVLARAVILERVARYAIAMPPRADIMPMMKSWTRSELNEFRVGPSAIVGYWDWYRAMKRLKSGYDDSRRKMAAGEARCQ